MGGKINWSLGFWGPHIFQGGPGGDQLSLTEYKGVTINLTANEKGSLEYNRA